MRHSAQHRLQRLQRLALTLIKPQDTKLSMKTSGKLFLRSLILCGSTILTCFRALAAEQKMGENPADHLPPHISQVTSFGERADWSHNGKKILFLSKTFGDAMELDLETKRIRNLTAHYPHHGYARALYLADGNILLSGPEQFDPKRMGEARVQGWLYVLAKRGSQ